MFCLAITSCGLEEPYGGLKNNEGVIEFVARPVGFLNQTADTKAAATTFEKTIYNCFFLLFDNTTGALVGEAIDLTSSITNNSLPTQQVRLEKVKSTSVTACFIANVPKGTVEKIIGLTRPTGVEDTDENNQRYLYSTTLDIEYSSDGTIGTPHFDLNGDNNRVECIPMIGVQTISLPSDDALIQIPIKRLFAKVCFNINLNLNESGESGTADPYFHIDNCIVNNLPTKVAFNEGKYLGADNTFKYNESAWADNSDVFTSEYQYEYDVDIENDDNENNGLKFEFYVPEYILLPDADKLAGTTNISDNSAKERLKPTLLRDESCPLYVSIKGIYGSVFGEEIEMTYDVYPGANPYDDFSLIRNVQYNNNVTIRGTSYADNRVEMKYAGFHVGFPHSVQMDSHFNVRPLRLKFSDDFREGLEQGIYADGEIKIEVLGNNSSWIALERPIESKIASNSVYSKGVKGAPYPTKRKYFTTGLIAELNQQKVGDNDDPSAGSSVTFRTDDYYDGKVDALRGDVITWVYVDEYATQSTSGVREATIAVSFTMDGSSEGVTKQYLVRQNAIYPLEKTLVQDYIPIRTYGVELFEEYTMNYDTKPHYDSNDNLGFYSDINGIRWGLDDLELSRNKPALYVEDVIVDVSDETSPYLKTYMKTGIDLSSLGGENYNLINTIITPMVQQQMTSKVGQLESYYDFYTSDDVDSDFMSSMFGTDDARDFQGFIMNIEIIHTLLEKYGTLDDAKLNGLILDETPLSAIAYCYNKNKRNANGEVITINADKSLNITNYHWYTPSIKEIEEIMQLAYDGNDWKREEFDTFGDDKLLYWSCQPAYLNNEIELDYTANTKWTIDGYTVNWKFQKSPWSEELCGTYYADAYGSYLQDDVERARATRFNTADMSLVKSNSAHVSNVLTIEGTFPYDPHTESGSTSLVKKSDVLDYLTSPAYWYMTGEYFTSLSLYLNKADWSSSGVASKGESPKRGAGNQSRS